MAARRKNEQRATDRLNLALARVQAVADMFATVDGMSDKQAAVTALRKQLDDAMHEAHSALGEIRRIAGMI